MEDFYKKLFFSPDEKLIAVLKQSYLTSAMLGELKSNVLVLSDKRLYQQGKIFEKSQSGRWSSTFGQKTVDVKDITGSGFAETNSPALLIFSLIVIFFCFIIMITLIEDGQAVGGVLLLILSLLPLLAYFLGRTRLFAVNYSGGSIGVDCKWYSPNEINEFQKQIYLNKDRIKQNS